MPIPVSKVAEMSCLEVEQLTVRFGGLVAVDDLQFSVQSNSIHSLIGPNGAGKTTVINTITGLYPASAGSIRFHGQEILGARPHRISRAGIARTFQNIEVFPEMTVLENVLVGAHCRADYGPLSGMLRTARFNTEERMIVQRAEELLNMVGLSSEVETSAADLPFAEQRLLELARALAGNPTLLMLDEPAAGLRAAEIDELNSRLVRLRDQYGLTILLVDHVMQVIMNISDHVTVLNFGRKIADGTVDAVRINPEVRRAYLGDRPNRARNT
jgi:branched-chain amino acid transport system ATP-binding protein